MVVRLAAPDAAGGGTNKKDLWIYSRTTSDEARHISKYEVGDKMRKPAYAFSGEKASAGKVGVVRLELTTSGPPDQHANQLRHTPVLGLQR